LLREISPAASQDFVRRRTIQGRPDLKRTYIHNFDARWELFPSRTEVLAASIFYKHFRDAIETVVKDDGGNLSYQNTESAYAYGAELEARFGFGYLADALDDLIFGANFAFIQSRVELASDVLDLATSKKRPLSGQSPYVVNLTLGYSPADTGLSLNVFYNVFGRRIQEVGIRQKPDVYEEPFHSLDFTASYQLGDHWTLGATATNLLFQDSIVREGTFEFSRIKRGSSFGLRLGFSN
jgi:outer membrane receptor protein involved in Fe transport